MKTRFFNKSLVSSIIFSSILAWTMICFMGTLFIIVEYGILAMGLIATIVTFFFTTVAWAIPITGLSFLYPFITPADGGYITHENENSVYSFSHRIRESVTNPSVGSPRLPLPD